MQLTAKVACVAAVLFAFAFAPAMHPAHSFAKKAVIVAGDDPKVGSGTG